MRTDTKLSGKDHAAAWEVEASGGRALLRLSGEIDLGVASDLYTEITGALHDQPAVTTCDLGGVSFLDSSGLHLLLKLQASVHRNGGRFYVGHPSGSVRRLFELVGASDMFEVVE